MNQRPTGVTILAILAFIRGVILILFGGLGALLGGALGAALGSVELGALAAVWGLISIVLGAAFIYVGWGFWRLVSATWRFGIFLAVADILVSLLIALFGGGFAASTIIAWVIDAVIIYYLLTPGVKAAFGITGDLTTELTRGMSSGGSAAAGGGAAAASAPPPPAAPAEPPAAPPPPPPAAPAPPAAEPPASTWTGDSSGGTGGAPSGGGEDTDQNA
jgi:hypothetical protein